MLLRGLLASVEHGINRVLRLDSTALPRLARLSGHVIKIDCRDPSLKIYILPSDEGLLLAPEWAADADCTLRAPASSLLRLALSKDKTAVLHGPEVELDGDSGVLLNWSGSFRTLSWTGNTSCPAGWVLWPANCSAAIYAIVRAGRVIVWRA